MAFKSRNSRAMRVARADESSQLESNSRCGSAHCRCALRCANRTASGPACRDLAQRGQRSGFGVAEPESKNPASRRLITSPSRPIWIETVCWATWLESVASSSRRMRFRSSFTVPAQARLRPSRCSSGRGLLRCLRVRASCSVGAGQRGPSNETPCRSPAPPAPASSRLPSKRVHHHEKANSKVMKSA